MSDPFGSPADDFDPSAEEFELEMPEEGELNTRLVPNGDYKAKVISVFKDYSRSSGNPMWVWDFVVTEGKYAGREFRSWTVISPSAMWKMAEVLDALGLGKPGEKIRFTKDEAINRRCIIEMVEDEWNGQKRSSIQKVKPHPGGPTGVEESTDTASDDDIPF